LNKKINKEKVKKGSYFFKNDGLYIKDKVYNESINDIVQYNLEDI